MTRNWKKRFSILLLILRKCWDISDPNHQHLSHVWDNGDHLDGAHLYPHRSTLIVKSLASIILSLFVQRYFYWGLWVLKIFAIDVKSYAMSIENFSFWLLEFWKNNIVKSSLAFKFSGFLYKFAKLLLLLFSFLLSNTQFGVSQKPTFVYTA